MNIGQIKKMAKNKASRYRFETNLRLQPIVLNFFGLKKLDDKTYETNWIEANTVKENTFKQFVRDNSIEAREI